MPVGKYNLWLILSSHDTLAIPDVYVAEGQTTQMTREIPTHYGYLEVNTDPDSADIWLDGVRIGPSPYINNLVLPGNYALKAIPKEAHMKTSMRSIVVGKGDSIRLSIQAPYRDKSYLQENLSLPPWRVQAEAGIAFRSWTGEYQNSGSRDAFATDSFDLPTQWDFPVVARLGLPHDLEAHILLPFASSRNQRLKPDSAANFKSNMRLGLKYTYRPLNLALDASYGFGFKRNKQAFDHDYLALTAIGAASRGKIYGQAQAGIEFHFASKQDNKFDPGDVGVVHAQVGYLLEPFTPYLGVLANYHFDATQGGKSLNDAGYQLVPEPGFILDFADKVSLQFGVPFTIVGKSVHSYWGLHLSLSAGVQL